MIQHVCDVCNKTVASTETYGVVSHNINQPAIPQGYSYHDHDQDIVLNVQVAHPQQLCGQCLSKALKNLLEDRYDATVQLPLATDPNQGMRSLPPA